MTETLTHRSGGIGLGPAEFVPEVGGNEAIDAVENKVRNPALGLRSDLLDGGLTGQDCRGSHPGIEGHGDVGLKPVSNHDGPLDGAYYYFDAVATLAFAMVKAVSICSAPPENSCTGEDCLDQCTGECTPELRAGGLNAAAVRSAVRWVTNSAEMRACRTGRQAMGWDEIDYALPRVADRDVVIYTGLTGPISLDDCGERWGGGVLSTWEVRSGQIVDVDE